MLSTIYFLEYNAAMNDNSQQITVEFLRIWSRVKVALMELAETKGLTMQQTQALYSIWENGSLPMNAVAQLLHCDASNVTGIVDRLVHQELVERREDADDRRTKVLTLTPKGQEIITAIAEALPHQLAFDKLDAADCQALSRIFAKLRDHHASLSK
jgi:DNA-binding MarR family transcriptional regulator